MNKNKKTKHLKVAKAIHYLERHMDFNKLKETIHHNDNTNK